ncbi:hypothetical protein ACIQHY_34255 [Streptomyces sp. NPDC092359]|uniref:hypothetical protein n=1 Tax=Streptomyces sp. NPDC092359 TaxID=3366014 RepID=UPI0037F6AFA4
MNPSFNAPELAAIYRNLVGGVLPPAEGERPTPANMPRRIQRSRTAADIARAEGLDLGPLASARRPVRRRPTLPARIPARQVVVDRLLEAGCPRPRAQALATDWLRALSSPYVICCWIAAIGPGQFSTAAELIRQGFGTDDLDTPLDGVSARRRLSDGEAPGQVVGRLLTHRSSH